MGLARAKGVVAMLREKSKNKRRRRRESTSSSNSIADSKSSAISKYSKYYKSDKN
jgi:hypothetical protein